MFGKIRSLFRQNRESDDPDLTCERDDRELTYERALRLVRAAYAYNFWERETEEEIRRDSDYWFDGLPYTLPYPGTTDYYNLAEGAAEVTLWKYPKKILECAQNIIEMSHQGILPYGTLTEAAKIVVERMGKELNNIT